MVITKEFNKKQIEKLKKIYAMGKDYYIVDLHLHSNYSIDGSQTVEQIYEEASKKNIDIISITDHDSIQAYNDISIESPFFLQGPILIPGIEFSVSVPKYNGRCHILKYFYDEHDERFQENIKKIQKAYENRIDIWFQRIKENRCLQFYAEKYGFHYSKDEYLQFMDTLPLNVPDYYTIMEYIYLYLDKYNISVWDVFYRTYNDNQNDSCIERREKKKRLLDRFYSKYQNMDIGRNYHKLRPILAPVGVDDFVYRDYPSEGNLSVIEYGQVEISELLNSGFNIWAHPDINDADCVNRVSEYVSGYEINCRSDSNDNDIIKQLVRERDCIVTKGSDKHVVMDNLYDNMDFYKLSREELERFIVLAEGVTM